MRLFIAFLIFTSSWLASATAAPAAAPLTVQGAMKLLTKDQAKNLVRIEARDGTPEPDRWYFQVYDPTAENGLREIVVWEKAIVASRTISQFLDSAKPEDVIGAKQLKIDSDDLIGLIQKYVEANSLDVAKINFTLYKDPDSAAIVWKLTCLDDSDKKIGELDINARTAAVLSHEGFDLAPGQPKPAAAGTPPDAVPVASAAPASTPIAPIAASPTPAPVAANTPRAATPMPVNTPAPLASPTPKRGFFQKIFGTGKSPAPTPKNH